MALWWCKVSRLRASKRPVQRSHHQTRIISVRNVTIQLSRTTVPTSTGSVLQESMWSKAQLLFIIVRWAANTASCLDGNGRPHTMLATCTSLDFDDDVLGRSATKCPCTNIQNTAKHLACCNITCACIRHIMVRSYCYGTPQLSQFITSAPYSGTWCADITANC